MLWGKNDASSNTPKYDVIVGSKVTDAAVDGNTAYQNTTPSALTKSQVVGLFGVDEVGADAYLKGVHSGWVLVRQGMGPVESFTTGGTTPAGYGNNATFKATDGVSTAYGYVSSTNSLGGSLSVAIGNSAGLFANLASMTFSGGANAIGNVVIGTGSSGFSNTDYLVFSNGVINAYASVSTNSLGGITGVTINPGQAGAGFAANTGVVVTAYAANGASSNGTTANVAVNHLYGGTNATFSAVLGGRSGRVSTETLVAMSSFTATTNSSIFEA
jgi:hypothetical protein